MNSSCLPVDDFYPLIEARHCDPFRILGVRRHENTMIARVFRPDAAKVVLVPDDKSIPRVETTRVDDNGLFEGIVTGFTESTRYTL